MNLITFDNKTMRTTARWMLVLFVLSWINLAIQAPVHAAMKQEHKNMSCDCQPTICDTVLSMEQQSDEALSSVLSISPDYQIAFVFQVNVEQVSDLTVQTWQLQLDQHRQTSPPPLLLKTVLLI